MNVDQSETDRRGTLRLQLLVVLAVAVAVRATAAFPSGKFPGDADALLTGMRTLDILTGKFHVFYSRVRLGALESYLHVPFVALLGPTRSAVSIAPLLEGVLAVYLVWLLARQAVSPAAAVASALFFAVPALPFLQTTILPTLYGTILLAGVAVLALAARYDERPKPLAGLALGVAAGLGLWCSVQTLSCTVAAYVWLFSRRRTIPRPSLAITSGAGFVLGGLPWFVYNVQHRFESLRNNYGTDLTRSFGSVLANAFYALTEGLPALLTTPTSGGAAHVSVTFLLLFHAVAVFWYVASGLRASLRRAWALPALAAILSFAFFCVSSAGEARITTVRFFILCYPLIAIAGGVLVTSLWRRSRPAAIALTVIVLAFQAVTYEWPWSAERGRRREEALEDARLLDFLKGEKIDAIIGDYWSVYPFNYLSAGRVRAISGDSGVDYHEYGDRLPDYGARWALVSGIPGVIEKWKAMPGTVRHVGHYTVLLPDENPPSLNSTELRRRLQWSFFYGE